MLIRLVLLFLIVMFLIWVLKKQFGGKHQSDTETQTPDNTEDMVECEYCGTHVPKSLAVKHQGKFYCGDDHVDLDRQA
jgi:formylmethanofuran dehydrogenase subunit E